MENGSKRQKLSPNESGTDRQSQSIFNEFAVDEILSEYSERKLVCVKGRLKNKTGDAVVILEKTPFSEKDITEILNEESTAVNTLDNDVYQNYNLFPNIHHNGKYLLHC